MGNSKIKILGGVFLLVAFAAGLWMRPHNPAPVALRVCTWSGYFPEAAIRRFTQSTGIRVELSYISSNEELFAKFKAGATGYDIIQPSDYMVKQMARLGMLAEMDPVQLPHLGNLDPFYTSLPYDPGLKFSVPFSWGTTGLAIHTGRVPIPPEGVSWSMLLNSPAPKHTSALDDMREVFAAVFYLKGIAINTQDQEALILAQAELRKMKDRILMFNSEPKPLLLREEVTIAHTFSTDGLQAQRENPQIRYFIPKEGATLWTDNFAIPKTSHRVREAHLFIEYFLQVENIVPLLEESLLATPNQAAREKLSKQQVSDPNRYPPKEVMDRLQILEDTGETLQKMSRLWTEIKT